MQTHQPPKDAVSAPSADAYKKAAIELHSALSVANGVLEELATLMLDYIDNPTIINHDSVRDLCKSARMLARNTKASFDLSSENPVDKTHK